MTDKEFKRLSRSQLIDIIYQFQLKQDELIKENERLSQALEDKRIRVSETGNLAEAALEIHKVMEAAQNAAAHYIEEMQLRVDEECRRIVEEQREKHKEHQDAASYLIRQAEQEAAEIIVRAKAEAEEIRRQARQKPTEARLLRPRKTASPYDPVEAILRDFRNGQ